MKRAKEIFDKYLIQICVGVLVMFGTALYDYANRFFSMPTRVEKLEAKLSAKKDSLLLVKFDSTLKVHQKFLEDDYNSIKEINTKLQENGIR